MKLIKYIWLAVIPIVGAFATSCSNKADAKDLRYDYPDILDIAYTPDTLHRHNGLFTDAGSWIGFTPPESGSGVSGFCGPYSIDMNRRQWLARCAVNVLPSPYKKPIEESSCYYPGELVLNAVYDKGSVIQKLHFVDAFTMLLSVEISAIDNVRITGDCWGDGITLEKDGNSVVACHESGETFVMTFPADVNLSVDKDNYVASVSNPGKPDNWCINVAYGFFFSRDEAQTGMARLSSLLASPDEALAENTARWNGYLKATLRDDMPSEYDRIAVKAMTTLASNHRVARGGLLHDGIIPSHAVGYFVGLWAWDSWRFAAGAASFDPELAKNNIRAMFDYQLPDGMIIDCIYTDPAENNSRDSKPPLVCWAVDKIYEQTGDRDFLAEMYPQLLSYYKWWYAKRDHDGNGMCEYGSTDGTLEAAAWESGMDNAIRFDDVKMLPNEGYTDAWSMDQESVDLNAYLANEARLLKKFADILGVKFDAPDHSEELADYFFDDKRGFFFDKSLEDRNPVGNPGCEAYTMLWTGLAKKEQVDNMMPMLTDTTKFSTYIPFPTIAADDPKYNPRGYWRGPIWLDQTYFAIHGLRNYGYDELADEYTRQVFDRLDGLKEGAPIHENYDTHTGARLKAPHFSWSASHLIMLYQEYTGNPPVKD